MLRLKNYKYLILLCGLFIGLLGHVAVAQNYTWSKVNPSEVFKSQTAIQVLEGQLESFKARQAPATGESLQSAIAETEVDIYRTRLNRNALQIKLKSEKAKLNIIESQLTRLIQSQVADVQQTAQERKQISTADKDLATQKEIVELLIKQLQLSNKVLELEKGTLNSLNELLSAKNHQEKLQNFSNEIEELTAAKDKWLAHLGQIELAQSTETNSFSFLEAEENIHLIEQRIELVAIEQDFLKLQSAFELKDHDLQLVSEWNLAIDEWLSVISAQQLSSKKRLTWLESYKRKDQLNQSSISILESSYKDFSEHAKKIQERIRQFNEASTSTHEELTYRQKLPSSLPQWQALAQSVIHLPAFALQVLEHQTDDVLAALEVVTLWQIILLISTGTLWLIGCYRFWRVLRQYLAPSKSTESFSKQTLSFIAQLLVRNVMATVLIAVIGLLTLTQLIFSQTFAVLLWLSIIWLGFKIIIAIARITLMENTGNIEGRDVKLFQWMRAVLVIAGLYTAVIFILHQLALPEHVSGFLDRSYMLILLVVSYPLLRHSDIINDLFKPYTLDRVYLHKTIRMLSFLFPLTVFSNALIGLVGYVNLAWHIGLIEAKISLVFCAWLVVRGLMGDALTFISQWLITKAANGWLWTQAVLKPIHQILSIIITILAVFVCLSFLGINLDSPYLMKIREFISVPLLYFGDNPVTLKTLAIVTFSIIVLIWAIKWSREFSYRWFFHKVRDSGVRNSLSVFTQYGVVILGFFIILRMLGIDLTTLTVVAAAFSVGIAFGVRDIVNNILSGFFLLIERPVRKGDWIIVGDYEGEVTHIGLRAVTVRTGKNTEVIIPNTETVTKPFVNLTHRDSTVRNDFQLPVDFNENPQVIKQVVEEAMLSIDGIIKDRGIDVVIKSVSGSALMLEVRYLIDMRITKGRSKIKSEAISKIIAALKGAGIDIPVPKQEVALRNTSGL